MFNRPTPEQFYEKYQKPVPILENYKNDMLTYLTHNYPQVPIETITDIINNQINARFKDKSVTISKHDSVTEAYEQKTGSLIKFTDHIVKNFIHSPSGACYQSAEVNQSLHTDFIIDKQDHRKVLKKRLHEAEANNDVEAITKNNTAQMNVKIDINAVSGLLCSKIFYSSESNYNAITAASRYGITLGYGIIERFISGNIYFSDINDVLSYLTKLKTLFPGNDVIHQIRTWFDMYQPTIADLTKYLIDDNYHKYSFLRVVSDEMLVAEMIQKMTDEERFFCYYALNLHNIVNKNIKIFKRVLEMLHQIKKDTVREFEGKTIEDIPNPKKISDVSDGDMLIFGSVICLDVLNYTPINKINDPLTSHIFAVICEKMEAYLNKVFSIFFEHLFNIDYLLHDVFEHSKMMRSTTLLSDTDSIIFTLQDYIKLMHGSLKVDDESLTTNAFFILLSFKHLEHVFNLYSVRCNVDMKNYNRIQIKNEFMYISMLRTAIRKTYIGINLIKEGTYLNPPKLDIKGGMFKNSSIKKSVKNEFDEWVKWLLTLPSNGELISIETIRQKLIEVEKKILDTKTTEYLVSSPIKPRAEYKDAMKSMYFNYIVYSEVFEPDKTQKTYLPAKFSKLPLKHKLSYRNYEKHLLPLRKNNKSVYDRLVKILTDNPKKELSAFYIPMNDSTIPEDIKYLVDYSTIVSNNMQGYYLILNSFGFGFPDNKTNKRILHDFLEEALDEPNTE